MDDFEKMEFSDSNKADKKTYHDFCLQNPNYTFEEGVDKGKYLTLGKGEFRKITRLFKFIANDVVQKKTEYILCVMCYDDLFGRSYKVKSLHKIWHSAGYDIHDMESADARERGERNGKSEEEIEAEIDKIPVAHAMGNDVRIDIVCVYSWNECKKEWIEGRKHDL